ncbi:transmembrane protein, partial [Cystoisospora suis]
VISLATICFILIVEGYASCVAITLSVDRVKAIAACNSRNDPDSDSLYKPTGNVAAALAPLLLIRKAFTRRPQEESHHSEGRSRPRSHCSPRGPLGQRQSSEAGQQVEMAQVAPLSGSNADLGSPASSPSGGELTIRLHSRDERPAGMERSGWQRRSLPCFQQATCFRTMGTLQENPSYSHACPMKPAQGRDAKLHAEVAMTEAPSPATGAEDSCVHSVRNTGQDRPSSSVSLLGKRPCDLSSGLAPLYKECRWCKQVVDRSSNHSFRLGVCVGSFNRKSFLLQVALRLVRVSFMLLCAAAAWTKVLVYPETEGPVYGEALAHFATPVDLPTLSRCCLVADLCLNISIVLYLLHVLAKHCIRAPTCMPTTSPCPTRPATTAQTGNVPGVGVFPSQPSPLTVCSTAAPEAEAQLQHHQGDPGHFSCRQTPCTRDSTVSSAPAVRGTGLPAQNCLAGEKSALPIATLTHGLNLLWQERPQRRGPHYGGDPPAAQSPGAEGEPSEQRSSRDALRLQVLQQETLGNGGRDKGPAGSSQQSESPVGGTRQPGVLLQSLCYNDWLRRPGDITRETNADPRFIPSDSDASGRRGGAERRSQGRPFSQDGAQLPTGALNASCHGNRETDQPSTPANQVRPTVFDKVSFAPSATNTYTAVNKAGGCAAREAHAKLGLTRELKKASTPQTSPASGSDAPQKWASFTSTSDTECDADDEGRSPRIRGVKAGPPKLMAREDLSGTQPWADDSPQLGGASAASDSELLGSSPVSSSELAS